MNNEEVLRKMETKRTLIFRIRIEISRAPNVERGIGEFDTHRILKARRTEKQQVNMPV